MIALTDVTKRFDGFTALDGLSLSVPKGAVYGLAVPNGAGKSTALRHIMGILRPDSGQVLVDGEPVYENPAVKARMAYIPDEAGYLPDAGVREMKAYYQALYPKFDGAVFDRLRAVFSIDPKQPFKRLSRGMQKQAAFWLALSMRPEFLILDEPMDGLDPVMRRQIWSLIMSDVAENGTTVLVSSHDLRGLADICDHVGIMNKGRMLREQDLGELQESVVKLQLVLPEGRALPAGLELLHQEQSGKMTAIVLRGGRQKAEALLAAVKPVYADIIPLTLEEIFIYELGGMDYEVKELIL